MDFENSSIPSSMQGLGRKKIPNSRVKTDRKPGGQPGHKGHCRKKHIPTETHEIPAPERYVDNQDYYLCVADPDPAVVADLESRYDKILDKADEEYEANPPGKYYQVGYNLAVRMREYKESELRFLHDKRVPANNSLCERLARVYKRKQKQAMILRSQKNLEYICDSLSTVHLLRSNEENVYKEVATTFRRKQPPKPKKEESAVALA